MPNVFKVVKNTSIKKMNGRTPQWFRDWHGQEFMEVKMRVTGLLWLVSIMTVSLLGCFGLMLANSFK